MTDQVARTGDSVAHPPRRIDAADPVVDALHFDPIADPGAVIVSGRARFTILAPSLIRLEWSPDGAFEDRASLGFLNRRLPVPQFTQRHVDDRLVIATDRLTMRYRDNGGRFDASNLSIDLEHGRGFASWHPGMEPAGNLHGTARTLDGVDGTCPLEPGILSRDGWAVVDESHRPLLEGSPPWPVERPNAQAIDWYFFGYGRRYLEALRDFTKVAGQIPMPPRYMFGAWWSRYWAYSADELRQLVDEFDAHDVPLDVLVIDMDWHLDGWTGYTWNPRYFPAPEQFLRSMHDRGLAVTLNLHPAEGVHPHEATFQSMARAVGKDPATESHIAFDCVDPKYVQAYFSILHHPLEQQGVDFWWIDWQQGYHSSIDGLDPLWWLNHLHFVDMQLNPERGGRRPIIFSRWGGIGNHRSPIGFSGDTYSTWEMLAFQPAFTATAGNVGYGYWSHDIGGHFHGPVEPEMYVRWIQWGALSPILRTHTTKKAEAERRIWKMPSRFFEAAREAFKLRYALLPYIRAAARQCFDQAIPLCRPLYYHWPELLDAYEHPEAYLFGNDMFVAPVAHPAEADGTARISTWLPPGRWVNWFTGDIIEGPADILVEVELNEIPLFVRAGAIIPTAPPMRRTGERPIDPIIFNIFGQHTGRTYIYDDDGLTEGYKHGEFTWQLIRHDRIGAEHRIDIEPAVGSFNGMIERRGIEIRLRHVNKPKSVVHNQKPIAAAGPTPGSNCWSYDAQAQTLTIHLSPIDVRSPHRVVAHY